MRSFISTLLPNFYTTCMHAAHKTLDSHISVQLGLNINYRLLYKNSFVVFYVGSYSGARPVRSLGSSSRLDNGIKHESRSRGEYSALGSWKV